MNKIFEQCTVDGELTPELIKRKQELDQNMEVELSEIESDKGNMWVPKERQYAEVRQKYDDIWEQELTDAGYTIRPVFESLEVKKFEDWYNELARLQEDVSEDIPEKAADATNLLIRTFGRKTYNLANPDELDAWFTANFEFQQKRYPDKYRNNGSINSRWLRLRANIARNLLATLEAEGVTNPQVIDRLQRIMGTGNKLSNYFTNDELNELFSDFVLKLSAKLPEKKLAAVRKKLDSIKQDLIDVMND